MTKKPRILSIFYLSSRVSSGSIVSDYGLDDRAIGVRFPAGSKDFSSNFCVQTGSEAHPASCTMGTGGPFPGGKARPRRDADHLPPSSAEVVNEELYLLSLPPSACMACNGTAFLLYYIFYLITMYVIMIRGGGVRDTTTVRETLHTVVRGSGPDNVPFKTHDS
jgi:hypothetical protein